MKLILKKRQIVVMFLNILTIILLTILALVIPGKFISPQFEGAGAEMPGPSSYQIVLNQNNQINWTPKTIMTENGNTVLIDYSLPKSISNGFVGLNNNGWFKNTGSISGLTQMTINIGSGSLLLSYGYSSTTFATENISVPGNTTFTYDFLHSPNYFRLTNTSGSTVNIYSLTLCYSCDFVNQTIGSSGLSFTLNADKKTYYVTKGTVPHDTTDITIPLVYMNRYVTVVGNNGFQSMSQLTSVILPASISSINYGAFSSCPKLENINLPNGLTTIAGYAFSSCSKLASIIIPSLVTTIGSYAFYNCTALTSIDIPSSITILDTNTFNGCSSLTSVSLPSTLTMIKEKSFFACTALEEVIIPTQVTTIGPLAFSGCTSLLTVSIPVLAKTIQRDAFLNTPWLTARRADRSDHLVIVNNVLIDGKTTSGDITIPSGVTHISEWSFQGNTAITSVTIPSTVTVIGFNTFDSCSNLVTVNGLGTITSIGFATFRNCTSLTTITIPSSVTTIGDSAFYMCTSLTSIVIPRTVTTIEQLAFAYTTNLGDIIVPIEVTTMGAGTFYNKAVGIVYCEAAGTPGGWNLAWTNNLDTSHRAWHSNTHKTGTLQYWRYVSGVPEVWA